MSTITTPDGATLLSRGKMAPGELQRYLTHQRACAATARRRRVRRPGEGKGSRRQQRQAWQ